MNKHNTDARHIILQFDYFIWKWFVTQSNVCLGIGKLYQFRPVVQYIVCDMIYPTWHGNGCLEWWLRNWACNLGQVPSSYSAVSHLWKGASSEGKKKSKGPGAGWSDMFFCILNSGIAPKQQWLTAMKQTRTGIYMENIFGLRGQ